MEQMEIPDDVKVKIDYDNQNFSEAIRTLRPVVFSEGDAFCCLLGRDKTNGIVGRGTTKEEAMTDWEANMRKRIIYHKADDEMAQFIQDSLNASKKEVG